MITSNKFFYFTVILSLVLLAPFASSESENRGTGNEPIYFSLIPKKNVEQQLNELKPLLSLIEKRLNRPVKVIRPKSYQSVIEGVLSKTIDFAILGPASYAKARLRDPQVEAFACFSSDEEGYFTPSGTYYFSVLYTIDGYGFSHVQNLKGKKIAMTDPSSTSGSVIPHFYFPQETGISMKDFFSTMVYTGSHDRAIKAVANNQVAAAFVSSARLDEAVQNNVVNKEDVVILWKSKPIHSDPFVFRGGLSGHLKEQLRNAILSSSPEISQMLHNMGAEGVKAVTDEDYTMIHEIVAHKSK